MKYLIFLCLLCGCTEAAEPTDPIVNAEFEPQIAEFRRYYIGDWPPYLSIEFGEPDAPYGQCTGVKSLYEEKLIIVRWSMWIGMLPEQRIATMFHELGHCVLGREHSSDPMSYMFIDLHSEQFYIDNKDTLTNELF